MQHLIQRLGILIIGDEIANGAVPEANATWLAKQLPEVGAELTWQLVVYDRMEDIVSGLAVLSAQVDKIVVSGGLGPTEDDLTAEAVAQWAHLPLEAHPEHLEFLKQRVRIMNDAQRKQAFIPQGAVRLTSDLGTACPFLLEVTSAAKQKIKLAVLPGVPAEFQVLWRQDVQRYLLGTQADQLKFSKWFTFGMGEAGLQQRCEQAIASLAYRPVLGFLITPQGVEVKLREPNSSQNEPARQVLDQVLRELTYSRQEPHLEKVCVELLKQKKQTVATAESCTGGWVAQRLTRIAGASDVFLGSVVAYDNDWKQNFLNVPSSLMDQKGSVSGEVVKAMCEGLEAQSKAQWHLAISGIAGPGGGSAEKPVGTVWIALKQRGNAAQAKSFLFYGGRIAIQRRAAQAALFWLFQELQ